MKKVVLSLLGAVLLVGAGGCKPKEVSALDSAGDALFTVLADETAKLAGSKKQVIVVATAGPDGKPSESARQAANALKDKQLTPEIKTVSLGDPMRYGSFGWSAANFSEVLQQNPDAGAVVSLVGAPLLKGPEISRVPATRPPVLVVAVAQMGLNQGVPAQAGALQPLLAGKVVHLAIVDGTETPTETTEAHKLFGQSYMRLRAGQ